MSNYADRLPKCYAVNRRANNIKYDYCVSDAAKFYCGDRLLLFKNTVLSVLTVCFLKNGRSSAHCKARMTRMTRLKFVS